VIDSQSVKALKKGGPASIRMAMMRGRKIKGKKSAYRCRHHKPGAARPSCMPPTSRIRDAAPWSWRHCSGVVPVPARNFYADAVIMDPCSVRQMTSIMAQVNVEIVNVPISERLRGSTQNDGIRSNELSRGLTGAVASPRDWECLKPESP